jgi:hypothetical protein
VESEKVEWIFWCVGQEFEDNLLGSRVYQTTSKKD